MEELARAFARAHLRNNCCKYSPGIHGVRWLQQSKPDVFALYMETYILSFYADNA